jgi:hypothetical protein
VLGWVLGWGGWDEPSLLPLHHRDRLSRTYEKFLFYYITMVEASAKLDEAGGHAGRIGYR